MDHEISQRADIAASGKPTDPLSREQIYELVWKEPMLRVGERFGVSSSYMARVCTELRIPRPPRGYWAQLEFGKAPAQPALPPSRAGDLTEWRPGNFIGATERVAKKQVRAAESADSQPAGKDTPVKIARKTRAFESERIHPLLVGIKPWFQKTRDSESRILRPYKRLMPDILSSKDGLDTAVTVADRLFRALTKQGHRVTIAPTGGQMRRAEVDLGEVPGQNQYRQPPWSPERPTVVYIGEVPIGLTLFEMTEQVEMLYVGDSKYIPVRNLTLDQRRKLSDPRYWKTTKDVASGRFCLQAYCPSWRVTWTKRWPEAKLGQLSSLVPTIVSELESVGPELAVKLEAARIQAEEEHRRWEEEKRRRKEAEDQALRVKRHQQSRQELLTAISAWDETQRIEAYFAEVERAARQLNDEEQHKLLDRLSHARELVGSLNPLELLLRWKTPSEM